MRRLAVFITLLVVAHATAASLPSIVPIVTPADLDAAVADASVSRIDLVIPKDHNAAENVLSKRFFNQPVERRFSGLLTTDWGIKWQLFSYALIEKAKAGGLDSVNLQTCLQRLNRGRNRETMLKPFRQDILLPPDATREETRAFEKKQKQEEAEYRLALKDRDAHPEKWYNDSLAVVPVGAFLGKHSTGECWIVVCKWEYLSSDREPATMGHVMIWAIDTQSHEVVSYVTCD